MTPVWRAYDQAALDAQYDQRTLVPDADAYVARWADRSARLRAGTPPGTLAYGLGAEETMDLFPGADGRAPAHLHLHGGAWRALSKRDASFVARGLGPAASCVAVADFGLAPATPLAAIAAQVQAAARRLIAERGPITVSGHSSGAHLASLLLATPDIARALRGALLVSGPYDLEPVRLSARNAYLHLGPGDAQRLTAAGRLAAPLPPVHVTWGTGELAEFQRQGADFAAALRQAGARVEAEARPGNHFALYDAFHDPAAPLMQAARALFTATSIPDPGRETT